MATEDIESLPILDRETAIKQLDDVSLFETMLMGFEDMSMRNNLTDLKLALEKADYYNIRLSSHSLKGASSYLRAERVRAAAAQVQMAVDSQKSDDIFKYYPILVKQCILLKRRIRYEACIKEGILDCYCIGKQFHDDETDFDVPIAKYYQLIKRSANDFDVIQVSKAGKMPQIPKYDFKQGHRDMEADKAPAAEVQTGVDHKLQQENTAALPSTPQKNPEKGNFEMKCGSISCQKPKVTSNAKPDTDSGKGQIKMDEPQKATGCNCSVL